MEKLDYELELKILDACFESYPEGCTILSYLEKSGVAETVAKAEVAYLIDSGLLRPAQKRDDRGRQIIAYVDAIFITAKGIDYLHDGGLGLKVSQRLGY